ncbi:hypothetical protein Q1695_004653 [Nippostrongylus brasiliensis]|nr:hypothetical protein Q1695_004653 [Nippostrongylus brasiliensis]
MVKSRSKTKASSSKSSSKRPRLEPSCFVINPIYRDPEFAKNFRVDLKEKKPFPHWQLRDFLQVDPSVIAKVEDELINCPSWNRKENDLYSLLQTPDLQTLNAAKYPAIRGFWEFLCGEMREWLGKTSDIELLPQVDSTGSCYASTDCLLPHSDQVENRRFAFVYYFTEEPWKESFGGQLNVYSSDDNCDPTSLFSSFLPHRNSLLLFEVSERSWHSVAEVVGEEHSPRLSINGWFHTTRPIEPRIRPPLIRQRHVPTGVADLTTIFSGQLLTEGAKESMRKAFKEEKELLIKSAFQETFSNEILDELDEVEWNEKGPVNKRWMAELDVENFTSESVNRFLKTIRSLSMIEFVREVTGFEYQDPQTITWSYRLTPGCYTVLGDEDAEQFIKDGMSVDFWFYFGKSQWDEEAGGEVVYIRKDEEEPVLRCPPTIGAVAMVHREKDVFPFLKYVNHLAKSEPIYVFGFSVYGGKSSASD